MKYHRKRKQRSYMIINVWQTVTKAVPLLTTEDKIVSEKRYNKNMDHWKHTNVSVLFINLEILF